MRKPLLLAILSFILFAKNSYSQSKTQNVRGIVIDKNTRQPLVGASVFINLDKNETAAFTDENGEFVLKNIPIGRRSLKAQYVGYESFTMPDFIVQSTKEPFISIELKVGAIQAGEVVISASKNAYEPLNELSVVSTRSFTAEETERMPAGINDPGRVALSYPGVQKGQDDSENQIVVRGNSPIGILWRLEGIDIPNPNHFALIGASGGGVTVFSSQLVAKSDFSTGGFAAEYGNALSGVFDVRFRNGNDQTRENRFKLGVLGIDFSTEGPLKKGNSSYLINYRYSTLGLLTSMGIYLVGERVNHNFQDLSFNLVFKSKNNKSIQTLFGMGGLSEEHYEPVTDAQNRKIGEANQWEDRRKPANMGAVGYTWTYLLNQKSFLKTVVAVVGSEIKRMSDTLDLKNVRYRFDTQQYVDKRLVATAIYQTKLSTKTTLKTGIIGNYIGFNFFKDTKSRTSLSDVNQQQRSVTVDGSGTTGQFQQYAQIHSELTPKIHLNFGYHYLHFFANNTHSLEPRVSLQFLPKINHRISLAYGIHARALPLMAYYFKDSTGAFVNKNLDLLKANHLVASYHIYTASKIRFSVEGYYQTLKNVPVEPNSKSNYWMLNNSSEFPTFKVESNGTGTNYGLDVAVEKLFSNSYYFLVTGSWLNSTYKTPNNITLNSRFNTGFTTSFTFGKEFPFKNGNILQLGARYLINGGFRYTPYDPVKSKEKGQYVEMQNTDFSEQVPAYRRLDGRIAYRYNARKLAGNISLDVQNVFNRINASSVTYNAKTNTTNIFYGSSGFVPVMAFQFDF
ncbi:MAG: TonB-dependent receptor [Cytophagaceae bacterium]|nr:TonB-dependent receptor [Cytophagaceae bacterium]